MNETNGIRSIRLVQMAERESVVSRFAKRMHVFCLWVHDEIENRDRASVSHCQEHFPRIQAYWEKYSFDNNDYFCFSISS